MSANSSKSVFDVYSEYLKVANDSAKSMLKSILVRFLVPEWGGQAPKSSRATPYEVIAAEEVLEKTPIKSLIGSDLVLQQIFELKNVDKRNRTPLKSFYKAFLKWAEENDYFSVENQVSETNSKVNLFTKTVKSKKNYHGLSHKSPYALMASKAGRKGFVHENDYINDKLKAELEQSKKFRSDQDVAEATVKKESEFYHQFLGWLHRYKSIPLETLSLTHIITHVTLSKKASVRQKAIDASKENIKIIEEYLDFLDGHPNTKCKVIINCISLAKFIFRYELDDDEYLTDSDFPIIKRLHLLFKKYKQKADTTPPTVPYSDKSISWELVYPVLEKLRQKACEHNYTQINKKGQEYSRPREKSAISKDFQLFLSFAFMVLMPPDRSRSFYDLEIGKTLVKGVYQGGRFTPEDRMTDKSDAKWYVHLYHKQYKTGRFRGEFWGEIHNYKFPADGTFLYDYMQKWIDEYRECDRKCNHNFFFRGIQKYNKLEQVRWYERITNIFYQETEVPVTPKELRKMYITYMKEQGVSHAELEAAAWWMKHSMFMQSSVYDQQDKMKKMAAINPFNQRIFDENMPK